MSSWLKSYKALRKDGFTAKDARKTLKAIFISTYLPHRTYGVDQEALSEGRLVKKDRTWSWRGRVLHRKTLNEEITLD